jgi:hypothetical protein
MTTYYMRWNDLVEISVPRLATRKVAEEQRRKKSGWQSPVASKASPLTTTCMAKPLMARPLPYGKRTNQRTSMPTLVWVIVILLLLGALPVYPYSTSWGYYPSGGVGLLLLILILVAVFRP